MSRFGTAAPAVDGKDRATQMLRARGGWILAGALLLSGGCAVGSIGEAGRVGEAGRGGGSGTGAGGSMTAPDGAVIPGAGMPGQPGATGTAPPLVLTPTSRIARLSHTQLVNTYRDLLKLTDVSIADKTLTLDAVVGFDNEAESLFVTNQLWANLQQVAEQFAHSVASNPATLAQLVPANAPTDVIGKATAFIKDLGLRAYRRPLVDAEVQQALTLFNQGPPLLGGTDAFAAGAELVLQFYLQSPYFIYRMELNAQVANNRIALSDYEVATKLSYALMNTIPDDTLFAAAAQGKVANSNDLAAQASRLIATPAALAAVEHFHFQMYRLGVYDGIAKDPKVYPQFTAAMGPALRQENLLFLDWIFNNGKGVSDIFTSPVSFVNNLLAPTYGLQGTYTIAFQQVTLDPMQRAGLLTQLGFLTAEATSNDVDTIHRGVFINQRVLCVVLPPPSPLAKPLPVNSANLPDRVRVESFTGKGTCAESCHATLLNPPGFAFEHYDSIGAYRTTDKGQPVNSADSYQFTDGTQSFNDAIDFGKDLAKTQQSHGCYVQNWATYLYARSVADGMTGMLFGADAPTINYLAQQSLNSGLPVKDLILSISTNDTFLSRAPKVN